MSGIPIHVSPCPVCDSALFDVYYTAPVQYRCRDCYATSCSPEPAIRVLTEEEGKIRRPQMYGLIVLKDQVSAYVVFDPETDVMIGLTDKEDPIDHWEPVANEPDIDVGLGHDPDLKSTNFVQVALRVRNAKQQGEWSSDRALGLTFASDIPLTLVNVIRNGQLKLHRPGDAWW